MATKKNQVKIEILKKGDTVLNVWENHVAVQKKSGEVEVFVIEFDENGLPRVAPKTFLITYGNETSSPWKSGDDANPTDQQHYHSGIVSSPIPTSLVSSTTARPSRNPNQPTPDGEALETFKKLIGQGLNLGVELGAKKVRKMLEKKAATNQEDKAAANNPNTPSERSEDLSDGD